jgi:hypothetical protein
LAPMHWPKGAAQRSRPQSLHARLCPPQADAAPRPPRAPSSPCTPCPPVGRRARSQAAGRIRGLSDECAAERVARRQGGRAALVGRRRSPEEADGIVAVRGGSRVDGGSSCASRPRVGPWRRRGCASRCVRRRRRLVGSGTARQARRRGRRRRVMTCSVTDWTESLCHSLTRWCPAK